MFSKLKDKLFGSTANTAVGVQDKELADARLGIIYFLGNSRPERLPMKVDFGLISGFVGDTSALKDGSLWLINQTSRGRAAVAAVERGVTRVKDWAADKLSRVTDLIKSFFAWLQGKLGEAYGYALDGAEWLSEYFGFALSTLTKTLADAIPGWGYVTDASAIISSVKQAVDGTRRWWQQYKSGKGVELLSGHPQIMAKALARHSAALVGSGIKDFAVNSTKLGLRAAGDAFAGVGTLVGVIIDVLQRIANLIDCFVQRHLLEKIFRRAKAEWQIRGSGESLVAGHEEFAKWFRGACVYTPVIAALCMSSGFAANPLRFIQLCDADGSATAGAVKRELSQRSYNSGVRHIETLKKLSAKYVSEYVEAYRTTFVSDDKVIQARLSEVIDGQRVIEAEPVWQTNPLYQGA